MVQVSLRDIAHARSGEKGNNSNVTVVAYRQDDFDLLKEVVTVERVRGLYGPITKGNVTRYEAPKIGALNFVLQDVLEGGRSRTLAFEESGKALSSLMMTMMVEVPEGYVLPERSPRVLERAEAWPLGGGRRVRLGSATGWARDRFEPAADLVRRGNVDYLCFDSMSEVTMSAMQVARMDGGPGVGYDPYLEPRLRPILKECKEKGVRIVTNQGWLDPETAAEKVRAIAREQGIEGLVVAAVTGGILTDRIAELGLNFIEDGTSVASRSADIVSAEAYMGMDGIVEALRRGADVVVTTRVADACVYLGPLAHEFGWSSDDSAAMARGMVIGHLMECGCQVSGGYFADPGYKDVEGLDDVGNPIAEVSEDRIVVSKLPGSGGVVSEATCKEQLLYEVQDPSRYLCPDVVVDLTRVSFRQVGKDEVEVLMHEGVGSPRTPTLKALVGLREGFMTEEMVLFAGPGALRRAELTKDVLLKRFQKVRLDAREIRMDYVGMGSVHREASPRPGTEPYEVVLRIALKADSQAEADKLRREVDALAVNGASGTGKWATSSPGSRVRAVVGLQSVLVPREYVRSQVNIDEINAQTVA